MYGVRHPIHEEFPGLDSTIQNLKQKDQQFARLLTEYDTTDKTIYGLEKRSQPTADQVVGDLKWRRIQLKDRIYRRLQARS